MRYKTTCPVCRRDLMDLSLNNNNNSGGNNNNQQRQQPQAAPPPIRLPLWLRIIQIVFPSV